MRASATAMGTAGRFGIYPLISKNGAQCLLEGRELLAFLPVTAKMEAISIACKCNFDDLHFMVAKYVSEILEVLIRHLVSFRQTPSNLGIIFRTQDFLIKIDGIFVEKAPV